MPHFLIIAPVIQKNGEAVQEARVCNVPRGKTLADLGYSEEEAASAQRLPRAPKDGEVWYGAGQRWVHFPETAPSRRLHHPEVSSQLEALHARLEKLEKEKGNG